LKAHLLQDLRKRNPGCSIAVRLGAADVAPVALASSGQRHDPVHPSQQSLVIENRLQKDGVVV
jgi:hypothetical protein